jgi:hypothetical protein
MKKSAECPRFFVCFVNVMIHLRLLNMFVCFLCFPCLAFSQDASSIYAKSISSIVTIITYNEKGIPLGLGSGFFVKSGVIATNLHVVEGAGSAIVNIYNSNTDYRVSGIIGTDSINDIALLTVNGLSNVPLTLSSTQPSVGAKVYVISNPEGLAGTLTDGIVSGIRKFGSRNLIQVSASISPGSSGGAILNSSGEVIGIAVGSYLGGQNLNFAIPVSQLKSLLIKSDISKVKSFNAIKTKLNVANNIGENPLSPLDAKARLNYYDSGEKTLQGCWISNPFTKDMYDIKVLIVIYNKTTGEVLSKSIGISYPSKCVDDYNLLTGEIITCIKRDIPHAIASPKQEKSSGLGNFNFMASLIYGCDGQTMEKNKTYFFDCAGSTLCDNENPIKPFYLKKEEDAIIKVLDFKLK